MAIPLPSPGRPTPASVVSMATLAGLLLLPLPDLPGASGPGAFGPLSPGLAAPGAGALQGQEIRLPAGHEDQRVDRIAAVVGDSIIFLTDLEEQLLRLEAAGQPIPSNPSEREALRRELLEGLVNEQLLLQAAARDTMIVVSDDRVESTLRAAWEDEIRRWGTEAALREELNRSQGLSVTQYRAQLRDRIRRDLTIQSYIQSHRRQARPVAITDQEIRAFYEAQQAVITRRPASIAFRQIFVTPRPGGESMAAARAEIERILALLTEGGDFAALARQYTQDEGTRQAGGDLGWFRRGDGLVREFEDAAFRVREGAVVGPIETIFGAHLIRVDRVRGAERRIRHILITAEVTEEDMARAEARAQEARERLTAGGSVAEFIEEQRAQQVREMAEIPREQLNELPPAFADALRGASEGDILGPIRFDVGPGQSAWAVFEITRIRDEGAFTLEDLEGQIRERLQAEKLEERMIRDLRARTWVDIRI